MAKNRQCPACHANGHDSGSDHLFMMSDGMTWFCNKKEYHADGKAYREVAGISVDPGGEAEGSMEALLASLETEELPPVPEFLPVRTASVGTLQPLKASYRGIHPSTFSKYGVQGKHGGTELQSLQHVLYDKKGKPVTTKNRNCLKKDFWTDGKTGGVALKMFGQQQFPSAKRLLIVEGEIDAMSAYELLSKWKVIVWSVPVGANAKCIIENMVEIAKFCEGKKELTFCMDNDDAGEKLSKDLSTLFPKGKHMKLTDLKDANEYLQAGRGAEFISAFWDADVYRPESIIHVGSILKEVLAKPVVGMDWPWPSLTAATYGRRGGEGMFVGAGVKCGKSEWINELIAFDIGKGESVGVIKFEEIPPMTVKRVAGKMDGIFYHKPGVIYKDSDLEASVKLMDGRLILHQAFGTANWDTVKEFIRYCVFSGCKTIIIDPITKITNGLTPSETETELRRFSNELACMAQDLDFYYVVTCHLKAPNSGPSHERGGKVETYQFRGSRSMAENCYYFLGIERNKDPDITEDERNTSTFVLLEDRAFGNVCKFKVKYNRLSQSYLEPTSTGLTF